jgi:hypothetical protein
MFKLIFQLLSLQDGVFCFHDIISSITAAYHLTLFHTKNKILML